MVGERDVQRARRSEGPGEQQGQERPHPARGGEAQAEADVEDDAVHFRAVIGMGTRRALRCAGGTIEDPSPHGAASARGARRGSGARAANRNDEKR